MSDPRYFSRIMLASFSSAAIPLQPQNQVFINFRGKQLRMGFVSHLVSALEKDGINVFLDEYENRGEDLTTLFSRIKESKVALVIFSSMYTESKWCLDELEEIMECVDSENLVVIPIFYKMKITDVKYMEGKFGDKFRRLTRKYEKGDKWRKAIEVVSQKFGIAVDNRRKESEYVNQIVGEVMKVITNISRDMGREIHDEPALGKWVESVCFSVEIVSKKLFGFY